MRKLNSANSASLGRFPKTYNGKNDKWWRIYQALSRKLVAVKVVIITKNTIKNTTKNTIRNSRNIIKHLLLISYPKNSTIGKMSKWQIS